MLPYWMLNAKSPQPSSPNALVDAPRLTRPVKRGRAPLGNLTLPEERPKGTIITIPQWAAQPGHPTEKLELHSYPFVLNFEIPMMNHYQIGKDYQTPDVKASNVKDWDQDK